MSREAALAEMNAAFSVNSRSEKEAQRVLERYWWCLLLNHARRPHCPHAVYRQIPIGLGDREYVPDFIIYHGEESITSGPPWWVITEIEPPGDKLLTKAGAIAKRLRSAYEQILDWYGWVQKERLAAEALFWPGYFNLAFRIIVGRRALIPADQGEKVTSLIQANHAISLKIHTFDWVIDRVAGMADDTWDMYERSGINVLGREDFRRQRAVAYDGQEDGVFVVSRSPTWGWRADDA